MYVQLRLEVHDYSFMYHCVLRFLNVHLYIIVSLCLRVFIYVPLCFEVHECSELHELLETETIQASVLRYKLKHYPQEIRDEIKRKFFSIFHLIRLYISHAMQHFSEFNFLVC